MQPRFPVIQASRSDMLDALRGEFAEHVDLSDGELDQLAAEVQAATPDRLSLVATRAGELVKEAMLEQSGGDWRRCLVEAAIETFGYGE